MSEKMQILIDAIKKIKEHPLMHYGGKGDFSMLEVQLNNGISDDKIDALMKPFDLELPAQYRELLHFSNGIIFGEYAGDQLHTLETVAQLRSDPDCVRDYEIEEKFLHIGTFHEDYIYLKCDGSERNVYVSLEGIESPEPTNMSFYAFMEASLISGFSYFWLWGSDTYDLY